MKNMTLMVGDIAPDFEFIDRDGSKKNFHHVKGPKFVYFYPKAFTPTCTKESCSIQNSYSDLKRKGIIEVFGISTDSKEKQEKFASKFGLEFLMVDDKKLNISRKYGVLIKKYLFFNLARRFTFLIDNENKIVTINNIGIKGNKTKYGIENYGKELLELNF